MLSDLHSRATMARPSTVAGSREGVSNGISHNSLTSSEFQVSWTTNARGQATRGRDAKRRLFNAPKCISEGLDDGIDPVSLAC